MTGDDPQLLPAHAAPQSLIAAQAKDILSWHADARLPHRGATRAAPIPDWCMRSSAGTSIGPRLFTPAALLRRPAALATRARVLPGNSACICCGAAGMLAHAVGVGGSAPAAREELRNGAHHIKVMAGRHRVAQRSARRHAIFRGGATAIARKLGRAPT
ncbi:MAG: hypothetical protein IPI73_03905 [Betaproteobacteria bacterium]|nr:hypothetical protein [Betaproteobacteria bacterium]